MEILNYLPLSMHNEIEKALADGLEEIRIRVGQQVELRPMKTCFGEKISRQQMEEIINYLTDYSISAYQRQIQNGFFTVPGGHRVGVAGTLNENGSLDISALNIRIAKQNFDCSKEIMPYILSEDSIYNTLFISGPGIGKTTYLRDCVRILSKRFKIGIVDERSEIGAASFGVPQNDLGPRCDLMDNCPKAKGMKMLLRSMSPEIIAVDEIGDREDFIAIEEMMNSGIRFIGTVHAGSVRDINNKKYVWKLIENRVVERLIFLRLDDKGKRNFEIYNTQGQLLWSSC